MRASPDHGGAVDVAAGWSANRDTASMGRSQRAGAGRLWGMLPEYQHDALLRLKTVRGHIDGVIAMVESSAYCADVMKQIAAMQASLEKVNRVLLENHLQTCVTEAIENGGGIDKVRELISALRFNGSLTDFRDRAEPLPVSE